MDEEFEIIYVDKPEEATWGIIGTGLQNFNIQKAGDRNALWSAWLRRPARSALITTWRTIASSLRDKARRAGLAEAIVGLPCVLSARSPISGAIDHQVKIAEAAFHASSPVSR